MRTAHWSSQVIFAIITLLAVAFIGRCVCQHVVQTTIQIMYESDDKMKQLRDIRH